MWSVKRCRQKAAANAVTVLVCDAVIQIRAMAYRRESLLAAIFPNTDYQEQIRLLADICDTLLPGLLPGTSHSPIESLQWTWTTRNDEQRRWLRQTLSSRGLDIHDIITVPSATDRRHPRR